MFTQNENDTNSVQNVQNKKTAPPDSLSGRHILLVDDVEINRMVIKVSLSKTDIVVHEAGDGQTALDMFAKSPEGYYDAIFMDIQMPGIDGFETTRRIREMQRPDARKTPIIAMTADSYEDMDEAGRANMDGYIAKPVDINEMKALLQSLTSG
ncbi:MAG: response regulator [Acidobacteriota bacterium]|jgi:CheY-like chemotaxis protein|nr:response regulator [Acidobacteriota bacterium]